MVLIGIEEKIVYKTMFDKKQFETKEGANEHILDSIRDHIDAILISEQNDTNNITRHDIIEMVVLLLPNFEDACLLIRDLNTFMNNMNKKECSPVEKYTTDH